MDRGFVVRIVLGGLAALAAADAAQAGIIFRRGWRNDCCCDSDNATGYRGGYHAYGTPMNSNAYANCCSQPAGTMVVTGMAPAPYTTAYGDPNLIPQPNAGTSIRDKVRMSVQVPTADTRIWVDQQFVQSSGTNRAIDVPLTTAQRVTVTAQWMKDGREVVRKKEVALRSGQDATVSFSDADVMAPAVPGDSIQGNSGATPNAGRLHSEKP